MHWIIHSIAEPPLSSSPIAVHAKPVLGDRSNEAEKYQTLINEEQDAGSYALICSQLKAAIEKRAAQLSKSVMTDLERRLLLRQQSDWFDTFLVALILLNCIERTTWLFMSWDEDKQPSRVSYSIILHLCLRHSNSP